jgi:hypothetical protein
LCEGCKPQHIRTRSIINKENFNIIAKKLFEFIDSAFGVWIITVRAGVSLVCISQRLHDLRVNTGVIVTRKSFHEIKMSR